MARITRLKILHWILIFISFFVYAFNYQTSTLKDFVLTTVIAVCLMLSGYIDRIIDELEGDL